MGHKADELLNSIAPKVRIWALQVKRRHLSVWRVEIDDLISAGMVAAWKNISTFDPSLGKFDNWCERSVKWAMLDYIRAADYLTRDERKKIAAGEMENPVLFSWQSIAQSGFQPSVDPEWASAIEARTDSEKLLRHVTPREREVLFRLRDNGPRAVAQVMGISESRVYQLQRKALASITKKL